MTNVWKEFDEHWPLWMAAKVMRRVGSDVSDEGIREAIRFVGDQRTFARAIYDYPQNVIVVSITDVRT